MKMAHCLNDLSLNIYTNYIHNLLWQKTAIITDYGPKAYRILRLS